MIFEWAKRKGYILLVCCMLSIVKMQKKKISYAYENQKLCFVIRLFAREEDKKIK
jgi:hypothetical protein